MGLAGARLDSVVGEEFVADQVWRLATHVADTEVDVGLAEIDRQQLRVTVGVVHQRDIAEGRNLVGFRWCG